MDINGISLDMFHFFIFIIPGFVTVWTFRYFLNSGKISEFEYFAASSFWGLINLGVYELIVNNIDKIKELLNNPYTAGIALSMVGASFGLLGSSFFGSSKIIKPTNWIKSHKFFD